MSEIAQSIVETSITEAQNETGTVTGTEFQNDVEQRVEATTDVLQENFGYAANELVGDVTVTMSSWKQSVDSLVGENYVGDTEAMSAAGYVERGSNKMVLSKKGNTGLHIDDEEYRKRVRAHEDVHQNLQATDYNAQTVTYVGDSGQPEEATVVGDLTEWQSITVANQPDSDLVAPYKVHKDVGNDIAEIAGESTVTSTLSSGDVTALQDAIIKNQREEILELVDQS